MYLLPNAENLSALAYANGFTLWHYKTPDQPAEVDTSGYFNDAATMLRAGDFIMANTNTGGEVQSGMFIVTSNTGTIVDVANMADFGPLNID